MRPPRPRRTTSLSSATRRDGTPGGGARSPFHQGPAARTPRRGPHPWRKGSTLARRTPQGAERRRQHPPPLRRRKTPRGVLPPAWRSGPALSILEPLGRELPPGSRRTQIRSGGVHRPPPLRQAPRLRPGRPTRGRGSRRVRSTRSPRRAPRASHPWRALLRGSQGPRRLSPRSSNPPLGRGGALRLRRWDPQPSPPSLPRALPVLPPRGLGRRPARVQAQGVSREEGARGRGCSRSPPPRGTPPEALGGGLGLPPLPTPSPRRGQRRPLEGRRSPPPPLGWDGYGGTYRGVPM